MQKLIMKKQAGRSGSGDTPYKRTHRVAIWLTEQELGHIKTNARNLDYKCVAQYVRQQSITAGQVENPSSIRRGLLDCQFQIHKLGINCNQIAKKLNQGSKLDREALAVLKDLQEQSHRAVDEVVKNYYGSTKVVSK